MQNVPENFSPRIFDYISPVSYLEQIYKFRKRKDSKFTFEVWAEELGFKSRSFLKMLIMGERKITKRFVQEYADKYSLSSDERDYFLTIVSFHQSPEHEKSLYEEKIFKSRAAVRDLQIIDDEESFLSSPLLPHVQTLLAFKDLQKTPDEISSLLGITISEAEGFLSTIKKMQLNESAFRVGPKLGSHALRKYHDFSLTQAMAAQDLPTDQRRYRSLIFALNEDEFAEINEKIHSFALQTIGAYEKESMEDRRLYKLNINLHPISKKRQDKSEK